MGDYEDTFHPLGTDGDDVEEMPSQQECFDSQGTHDYKAASPRKTRFFLLLWLIIATLIAFGAYLIDAN